MNTHSVAPTIARTSYPPLTHPPEFNLATPYLISFHLINPSSLSNPPVLLLPPPPPLFSSSPSPPPLLLLLIPCTSGTIVSNKSQWGWGLTFSQVALLNGLVPFLLVAPWLYS